MEILERISWSGSNFEKLKQLVNGFKIEIELRETEVNKFESEVEAFDYELQAIRDQVSYCKKSVSDNISSQVVSKVAVENMKTNKIKLEESYKQHKTEILNYRRSYESLKNQLQFNSEWPEEKLVVKASLEQMKESLLTELSKTNHQVSLLRSESSNTSNQIYEYEQNLLNIDNEISYLHQKIRIIETTETDWINSITEKEIRENHIKEEISLTQNLAYQKQRKNRSDETSLLDLNSRIAASNEEMEMCVKKYDTLFHTLQDITNEMNKNLLTKKKVESEITERNEYIFSRKREIEQVKAEIIKLIKLRDLAFEKCNEADEDKKRVEEEKDKLSHEIQNLQDIELFSVAKQIESQEKQILQCKKQLRVLNQKQSGIILTTERMNEILQVNRNGKTTLLLEKLKVQDEVSHQQENIKMLKKEIDYVERECEVMLQEFYKIMEQVKLQEIQIKELSDTLTDQQHKLKQKQRVYKVVRLERNCGSKELNEKISETDILKLKYREQSHYLNQLKKAISIKDQSLVKENFFYHATTKEKDYLKNEVVKTRKQIDATTEIVKEQNKEIMELKTMLDETEVEIAHQRNEICNLSMERNALSKHVLKRNTELVEMYNKIKLQQYHVKIGVEEYDKIIEKIKNYENQLYQVVKDNRCIIDNLEDIEPLRNQVVQLEKDLTHFRSTSRRLQDELNTSMNIHRWRIIESSDPLKFEKINRVHMLQTVLIGKTELVSKLLNEIRSKEKVYLDLTSLLERRLCGEVDEQIKMYQQIYQEKENQLYGINKELELSRNEIKNLQELLKDYDQEMIRLKQKWLRLKISKIGEEKIVDVSKHYRSLQQLFHNILVP